MELSSIIYFLIFSLTSLYFYSKHKFSYWRKRNVLYEEPTFFYGNLKSTIIGNMPLSTFVCSMYNEAKSKGHNFFGFYKFWSAALVPVDLELIKDILQNDFAHFTNRSIFQDEESDPLSGNLFNLQDEKWRNMRTKLTPTFTSGKMKMMFQTMVSCTPSLQELLKENACRNQPVEFKDLLSRFTTDIIGSVGFGIDINSMKNPDSEFIKQGIKAFQFTYKEKIQFLLLMVFPTWILSKFGMRIFSSDTIAFFSNLVETTVNYRETNNVYRKDFLHLLIQLKNFGRVTDADESILMHKDGTSVKGLTINEMAAQVFAFFSAGYETSATTMTFALLELGQNRKIQEKAREEIQRILKKYDNQITYEAIMEMEYLEKIILETLRKHPPASLLPRVCNKDYKIPGTDLVIKCGTTVDIPVLSIHRDPEYYPDPDKFDPERFSTENKTSRPAFTYLPFGEGPRICIGLRLGKLQAKVGLCSILGNYRITVNEKTRLPITYEPAFVSAVKGGVHLNLEPV